ncbi:MmcQ/YjbR family DNA-binding protein [Actinospica durhamensis]|uniref:MmcQ/YjbR family DNA-binding protein n=1 Tax=Actinospica durhamensis TaxID=1508375 RepID=A0A941EK83_9ACTN|nr:MmcQ/YjbR family DNA-binding protein [Actinospica durhamensis]MBR7831873.1 MmcQ/YjbR family DNA-binding protein [Actinospica durhamensis]
MATWDDVRRLAARLPETTEGSGTQVGGPVWRVRDAMFAWERPLRRTDVQALESMGAPVPPDPILAARVPDLGVKEALVADAPDIYFTIPHFDGYKAVLVKLPSIPESELSELLVEAWPCRAPKRLAKEWLARHEAAGSSGD